MQDIEQIFGNDYEVEGQMNIFDLLDDTPKPMIAVSKVFASAIKQMTLKEWKTFVYALMHINFTEKNSNVVRMDKWELVKHLGIESDATDLLHNLRRDIGQIHKHSSIEFIDKDRELWENGNFIERIGCYRDYVRIVFTPYYMPLFQELGKDRYYITLWADDLFQMTSERSVLFYESLRLHSDTRATNSRIYGTKDLKNLFGIPKDGKGSYMRKNGHLDRTGFEIKVLDPLVADLKKCKMINLLLYDDGKPYQKKYYHGRVTGYEFSWTVTDRPSIASAEEVQEIRQKVDENPKILKVAKDIVDGQKKPKAPKHNMKSNHKIDFEALEEKFQQDLIRKAGKDE